MKKKKNWENNFNNDATKITTELRNVDRFTNFTKRKFGTMQIS